MISGHAALVVEFDTAIFLRHALPPRTLFHLVRPGVCLIALGGGGLRTSPLAAGGADGERCLPLPCIKVAADVFIPSFEGG